MYFIKYSPHKILYLFIILISLFEVQDLHNVFGYSWVGTICTSSWYLIQFWLKKNVVLLKGVHRTINTSIIIYL